MNEETKLNNIKIYGGGRRRRRRNSLFFCFSRNCVRFAEAKAMMYIEVGGDLYL
jgi:hypothetical protein